MNGFETTLLRLSGVPQSTIDEVEKALPAVAALLKLYKQNEALIQKLLAVVAEAQPLVTQATPVINQALLEINAALPAAQDVIAFLQATPPAAPTAVDIMEQQGSGPT